MTLKYLFEEELKTNIKRSELSKSFHYSLRTAMSVWGLNDYKSAIYELLNGTYIKDEVVEADDTEITAEEENIKKILPVLPKRTRKAFELNSILYGAPGTGKTYATAKYALAITEGKSLEEYKAGLYGCTCCNKYILRNRANQNDLCFSFEVFTNFLKIRGVKNAFRQYHAHTSALLQKLQATLHKKNLSKTRH